MPLLFKSNELISKIFRSIVLTLKWFYLYYLLGYDQIPLDMQGLEIESHGGGNGSTYGTLDAMDVGSAANFDPIEIPTPPQENNQVAAWYDTDL